MKYRREIDGLRALAVVPVILFHAGFGWVSGGYIGVDVFFVISGYLITTLILEDLARGRFSLVGFYERRARRILPALFVVLLTCLPFAYLWMLPGPRADFSGSLVSVSIFLSNIYFWLQSGYFDTTADIKPLLHTWSLAVEEQFYLLFPLLLIAFGGLKRNRLALILIILSSLSFLLAQYGWPNDPSARFYLIATRAWELLAGALCAIILLERRPVKTFAQGLSLLGLGFILFSLFYLDRFTPFPGYFTLLPVLGSVLIILFASPDTLVGKLFCQPLFGGIGLVSYSAYLWHQPLFAFARIRSLNEPSLSFMALLCVVSFALAAISWRYVETPFRNRKTLTGRQVFWASGLFILFFAALGASDRLTAKNTLVSAQIATIYGDVVPAKFSGLIDRKGRNCSARPLDDLCVFKGSRSVNWVIIGDSHARVLSQTLFEKVKKMGGGFIDMSVSGCPFVPGFAVTINAQPHKTCSAQFNNDRLHFLAKLPPSTIVIHGRLPFYLGLDEYDNGRGHIEKGDRFLLVQDEHPLPNSQLAQEVQKAMLDAIQKLLQAGHKIVVPKPAPVPGWHVIKRINHLLQSGYGPRDIMLANAIEIKTVKQRQKALTTFYNKIAQMQRDKVWLIESPAIFCDSFLRNRCVSSDQNRIFYVDGDHLSKTGNQLLTNEIFRLLDAPKGPPS